MQWNSYIMPYTSIAGRVFLKSSLDWLPLRCVLAHIALCSMRVCVCVCFSLCADSRSVSTWVCSSTVSPTKTRSGTLTGRRRDWDGGREWAHAVFHIHSFSLSSPPHTLHLSFPIFPHCSFICLTMYSSPACSKSWKLFSSGDSIIRPTTAHSTGELH